MTLRRIQILLLGAAFPLAAGGMRLHYSFEPRVEGGRLTLHVDLEMSGIRGKETVLVLPSQWGDVTRLHEAVVNLRAERGDLEDTTDPARKIVRQIAGGRARISFDLVKDWTGPFRESVRHRAHLEPTYLEINTQNALVHPQLVSADTVDCTFDWKLPAGWSLLTSFGASGPRQQFRGAWDAVNNAMFAAGDFRVHKGKLGKGELIVGMRGKWSFPDEEAVSRIVKLVELLRGFWRDKEEAAAIIRRHSVNVRMKSWHGFSMTPPWQRTNGKRNQPYRSWAGNSAGSATRSPRRARNCSLAANSNAN